ncbi:MAG: ABC transporter substrate-binding protein [Gammaproteobacteria bacterium]|nr:ABC transporter substrate-binding protein [Gammaproteobacteria bacterium]
MTLINHSLSWPLESALGATSDCFDWLHSGTNICLDFHGDPGSAKLTVFSDGNHHMALEACCQLFLSKNQDIIDIFYATTPPNVLATALKTGVIHLGNLTIPARPDIFISPENIMQRLKDDGFIREFVPFARSQGNVMLVRKANPKNIQGIKDLLRDDIRLFISNPVTEKASYDVYREAILGIATEQGLDTDAFTHKIDTATFGQRIHHRECPQSLFSDQTDVAVIYYHLALRYSRIFPEHFDLVPFNGTPDKPEFSPANITTPYFIGVVNAQGEWGESFKQFMLSEEAVALYKQHGLEKIQK